MAASTRRRVSSLTRLLLPRTTLETVMTDTPASLDTSARVTDRDLTMGSRGLKVAPTTAPPLFLAGHYNVTAGARGMSCGPRGRGPPAQATSMVLSGAACLCYRCNVTRTECLRGYRNIDANRGIARPQQHLHPGRHQLREPGHRSAHRVRAR